MTTHSKKSIRVVWGLRILSAISILLISLAGIGFYFATIEEFPFPKFHSSPIHYVELIYFLILFLLPMVVLALLAKPLADDKMSKKRIVMASTLLALTVLSVLNPIPLAVAAYIPPVYTETDNAENYLQLGTCQNDNPMIHKLFPDTIPEAAETISYYYRHEHTFDPNHEVFAQWTLPRDLLDKEQVRLRKVFSDQAVHQERFGEWTCLFFTDYTMHNTDYSHFDYCLYAYNERTNTVRYISSYAMDNADRDIPYFLTLEW